MSNPIMIILIVIGVLVVAAISGQNRHWSPLRVFVLRDLKIEHWPVGK